MVNINEVIVSGRLTKDPELRKSQGDNPKSVCTVSIAQNYNNNQKVNFFNVIAWQRVAEALAQYNKKGDLIIVEGHLDTYAFVNKDGKMKRGIQIVAKRIIFAGQKTDSTDRFLPDEDNISVEEAKIMAEYMNRQIEENPELYDDLPF